MLACLFQLKTYAALRAKLAAVLVFALLVTGAASARVNAAHIQGPIDSWHASQITLQAQGTRPHESFGRGGLRTGCESSTRRNLAHGRPLDTADAHDSQTPQSQLEHALLPPRSGWTLARRLAQDYPVADPVRVPVAPARERLARAPPTPARFI